MKNMKNKLIFISGGSSGIGLAIAKAFAQQGNDVVIFARTISKLEDAKKEIDVSLSLNMTKSSVKINFYSVDTTNINNVKTIFEKAIEENGTPNILINCVGIAQPDYFENISFESFDKTIKTNLYSTWNVCSVVVPFMKKNGGQIINTSSIAGFLGVFGYTDYCMTKFGIIGFSEALKQELHQYNIKVQVLCPPDTDTPGLAEEDKTKPAETKAIGGKAKLLKSEFVAEVLIKEIQSKSFLIIPGFDGNMTRILKRFFPNLVDWVMMRSVRKVQKR